MGATEQGRSTKPAREEERLPDTLLEERRDEILVLTLNRPEALNAVSSELRDAFIAACRRANADEAVRAIVLTGAGRAFSAGQDLAEAAGYEAADVGGWLGHQQAFYQAARDLTKPFVAAINGTAAGAGFQVALCCDLRVASPEAKLGQPEVRAGLASIVGSYLISLHCGLGRNVELSLTGALVTGERAFEMGLVTHLAPRDTVLEQAVALARELGSLPAAAIRLTKRRFRETTQPGFDAACEAGVQAQREAYATGEPQRMMQAFLAKRSGAGTARDPMSSRGAG